jgi:hypothetical protein
VVLEACIPEPFASTAGEVPAANAIIPSPART